MNYFPKISIITPSYQQGQYIEETIQSVLSQNYPNLEYIIVDGGSTDETVSIIKKYADKIAYWVSEKDRGQTHAINKGIRQATGEIIAYLNSDDYYLPGTLLEVGSQFRDDPNIDLLHGKCRYVNEKGDKIGEHLGDIKSFDEIIDLWNVWWNKRQFVQPEVFWSRNIMKEVGLFNEELYYVMDYEYWSRILLAKGTVVKADQELTCFRLTDIQKSNDSGKVADELRGVVKEWLWDSRIPISAYKRLQLQGDWIYDTIFTVAIQKSVEIAEPKSKRWIKIFKAILLNPKIFLSRSFKKKLSTLARK
ncbi:MAG: glycosyltransferase family 2 protein [Limnothrix sp.]